MFDPVFDASARAVAAWHHALQGNEEAGSRGDRAGRASLRRCATLMEVVAEPQAHRLLQALRKTGMSKEKDDAALVLAAVLAATPSSTGSLSFARALGSGGIDSQVMRPMRFNSLLKAMQSGEPEAQIQALRRAVKLIGEKRFNHLNFIRDVLWFNDRTQRDWNYDYWQTPVRLEEATEATDASN